jgi:hypothetical protein
MLRPQAPHRAAKLRTVRVRKRPERASGFNLWSGCDSLLLRIRLQPFKISSAARSGVYCEITSKHRFAVFDRLSFKAMA